VTALNKMRNSEDAVVPVSFSRRLISTPHLPSDVATNERNIQTVAVQVARLPGWEEVRGRHLVRGVHRDVISSLLASLEIVPRNLEFAPGMNGELSPLIEFISSTSEPRLQNWDIAIPDGNAEQEVQAISIPAAGGTRHPKPRQRQFERARGSRWLKLNKLRVGDISDDYFDLTEAQINAVREAWENSKRNARKGKTAPGDAYVDYRDRPLLTLHVIEPISPEGGKNRERKMEKQDIKPEKLLAVSIRFPEFGDGGASSCVKYRLNKVALRGMGLLGEVADDEDDDED
jgi:hypothetical protein